MTYEEIKQAAIAVGGNAWPSTLIIQFHDPDADNPDGKFSARALTVTARLPSIGGSQLQEFPIREIDLLTEIPEWSAAVADLNVAALAINADQESQIAALTQQLSELQAAKDAAEQQMASLQSQLDSIEWME